MYDDAPSGYLKVYLGDNMDLTGCRKKKVEHYKQQMSVLRESGDFDIWKTGNHELHYEENKKFAYIIVNDDLLYIFTHLEYILWGKKKADKFRNKKPGSGYFKWKFLSPLFQKLRAFKKFKIKDEAMERAIEYAFNCQLLIGKTFKGVIIVGAHAHPKKDVKRTSNVVTLHVLPRGVNKREFE